MARRDAAPHDICEVRRHVVERLGANQRLVRGRQQRQTRSEARAEYPDTIVALAREPRDGAARVEHRLTAYLDGPRDVRADDVVGARELGWHALVVIGKAETQRAHAVPGKQLAQADVTLAVGVPLREDENGGAAGRAAEAARYVRRARLQPRPTRRKEPAHHGIVLAMRRVEGAWKRQHVRIRQAIVVRGRWCKEPIRIRHHFGDPFADDVSGRRAGAMSSVTIARQPFQAPIEGPDDAILAY